MPPCLFEVPLLPSPCLSLFHPPISRYFPALCSQLCRCFSPSSGTKRSACSKGSDLFHLLASIWNVVTNLQERTWRSSWNCNWFPDYCDLFPWRKWLLLRADVIELWGPSIFQVPLIISRNFTSQDRVSLEKSHLPFRVSAPKIWTRAVLTT